MTLSFLALNFMFVSLSYVVVSCFILTFVVNMRLLLKRNITFETCLVLDSTIIRSLCFFFSEESLKIYQVLFFLIFSYFNSILFLIVNSLGRYFVRQCRFIFAILSHRQSDFDFLCSKLFPLLKNF
ncbi:Uncharacterized protein TCM_002191 [Theobroma cacao]|uniref:Uncharacterized protein n=1 Tax=Theobroma cacao TaxID=3641 RepID=A0A061DKX5_THECC|nr:Uncharacterized protein TCM_002191 [Theobroma cacao]